MSQLIRNSAPYRLAAQLSSLNSWRKRAYEAPSPHFIKQACLIRNGFPNSVWVETGTYTGDTTRFLSTHAPMVYSVEPEPTLHANAVQRFKDVANVRILKGTSEDVLPALLPLLSGDVNFWLDGHYSAGVTFKGASDTPIVGELKCIEQHLARLGRVAVLVDDLRCFNPRKPEFAGYPPAEFLVQWAQAHDLHWHVEHDIFVATKDGQ
jgi:hypothetical protein